MTKTVAHLTTENDDLRARVKVLEGLINSDGNTSPLSKPKEESNGLSHNPESIYLLRKVSNRNDLMTCNKTLQGAW